MAVSSVACPDCSAVLKLSSPLVAGKKVRCPKCKVVFAPPQAIQAEPPRRKLAPLVEEDDSPRPRRKVEDSDPDLCPAKKRRDKEQKPDNAKLLVILGVCAAGLVLGGAVLAIMLNKKDEAPAVADGTKDQPNKDKFTDVRKDADIRRDGPAKDFVQDGPPKDFGKDTFPPKDVVKDKSPPRDDRDKDKFKDKPPPKDKPGTKEPEDPIVFDPPPKLPNAKDRPFLALDTGGHTAMALDVAFLPDGKRCVSISFDKTARLWDAETGETIRIFHVPVGPGNEGSLNALAVTRDGKKIAVGGWPPNANAQGVPIYLIDLASGRVERTLLGHEGSIDALSFSSDGKMLASCAADRTAIVFSVPTGKPLVRLRGHTDRLTDVAMAPNGAWLATASMDKTVRLWSLRTGKESAILKGHTDRVNAVAIAPDGRTVVTGGTDGSIRIWGLDGKLAKTHEMREGAHPLQVVSLTLTPDGKEALYTGVTGPGHAGMLDLATGRRRIEFKQQNNTAPAGALSPDGKLALTHGGDHNESYLWRTDTGTPLHRLCGKGKAVWAVGWTMDGKGLCWGNTNQGEASKAEHCFQLADLAFREMPKEYYPASLQDSKGWSMKRLDFFKIAVNLNGKPHSVFESPSKGERLYSFSLTSGGCGLAGGLNLYLFDLKTGKILRQFKGHTGIITSLSPSVDGRHFLSGGSDQILNVFHHEREEPLLSLFFADKEWIAWTPEGYYAASAHGERLMGWLVNGAPDQLAQYFPAIRFRASLYQPLAVKRVLRAGSIQRALDIVAKEKNKPPVQSTTLTGVLPPEASIVAPASASVDKAKVEVKASARSTGNHPVTAMRLLVNGRPWQGTKGVRAFDPPKLGEVQAEWEVELPPGRHELSVLADSAVSRGQSAPVEVTRTGADGDLPNLYVLAMGISAYSGKLRLHYAASDADLIVKAFRERSAGVFKNVEVKMITDQKATKKGILDGLDWLAGRMTPRDVAIVSFSGHGARDEFDVFHLVPVDFNPRNPAATLLSGDQFKEALSNLPGKVVCLLDACHSGTVAEEEAMREGRADDLVRDLVNDDAGVVVMCSSLGSEYSLESSQTKAGFFTLGVVEGLSGKADANGDQYIYIHELDAYAARRVVELSRGLQNPTTGKPPGIRSFPLSKP